MTTKRSLFPAPFLALFPALLAATLVSCTVVPSSPAGKAALHTDVEAAIAAFRRSDPGMSRFFDNALGYAVFPNVLKGASGIGGAHGRGELLEGGRRVGFCTVSQATIGFQLGAQAYREIIFFQDRSALDSFKSSGFEFALQASAVAVRLGASETADYKEGVVVFTMTKAGLMYEASVGGQRFKYVPVE